MFFSLASCGTGPVVVIKLKLVNENKWPIVYPAGTREVWGRPPVDRLALMDGTCHCVKVNYLKVLPTV